MLLKLIPLLLAIGAGGGFLSGLLGVGGGVIFVPALYYGFTLIGAGQAMHAAVGTSLALVMVTGATSAYWHHKKGSVDFSIVKSWGPFIVAGVAAGTYFAALASGETLRRIFAVAMLFMSAYMALSREEEGENPKPKPLTLPPPAQRAAATVIGGVAAMIGIGGASLTIPTMTYAGVPMRRAVGTGGALGTIIAVPGAAGYVLSGLHSAGLPPFSLGYVNLAALAAIAPFCFLMSPVGVHVSHSMPRNRLRRIFAAVLVAVSIRMFVAP